MNLDKNRIKVDRLKVTQSMIKSPGAIQPGDIIEVDFTQKPNIGEYGFYSYMTTQYIQKYKAPRAGVNIYKITMVFMSN